MALLSFTTAASRLRSIVSSRREYKPLLQAEFGGGDLYSQANCLFEAGYREAAIITGDTAIRRDLKRILDTVPMGKRGNLPEKSSSNRQYATHELSYFFFCRGFMDKKLVRGLNGFQKKTRRISSGIKASKRKGERMMADLNAFRPELDQAMGRALLTLPAHKRERVANSEHAVSTQEAALLAVDLTKTIYAWHKRVFGEAELPVTDPITLLVELRERILVSKKQLKLSRKLFSSPEKLGPAEVRQLKVLSTTAREQATTRRRRLADQERLMIGAMVGRGCGLEEIYERFGLTPHSKPAGVAQQAQPLVTVAQQEGGATCQS